MPRVVPEDAYLFEPPELELPETIHITGRRAVTRDGNGYFSADIYVDDALVNTIEVQHIQYDDVYHSNSYITNIAWDWLETNDYVTKFPVIVEGASPNDLDLVHRRLLRTVTGRAIDLGIKLTYHVDDYQRVSDLHKRSALHPYVSVKAYEFFKKHSGVIDNHDAYIDLALAEFLIGRLDLRVDWEDDSADADLSWMTEEERKEEHEVLVAILKDDTEVLGSLGGIIDPDKNYRRLVEAELADEALSDEIARLR